MRGALLMWGALAVLSLSVALAASTGTAQAAFGFRSFEFGPTQPGAFNDTPPPGLDAGGHPDLTLSFDLTSDAEQTFTDEAISELTADLPAGFVGDPTAVPQCTQRQFVAAAGCGSDAQVGRIDLVVNQAFTPGAFFKATLRGAPVFNLERRTPDETARLGFRVPQISVPLYISISPRTEGDYGLEAHIGNITRQYLVLGASLKLWGVPSDAVHDPDRFDVGGNVNGDEVPQPNPKTSRKPFLTAPTRCGYPLSWRLTGRSYQRPDADIAASDVSDSLTGCDLVPFDPAFSFLPTSALQTDSPSAFEAKVSVPQNQEPDGRAESHLQRADLTLPSGVSINPSVAGGLVACDDSQLRVGTRYAAACPAASSIGSAEVDVPILGTTLRGALVVRPQTTEETYRVALTASGVGVNAKIPGVVRPDPVTGQLKATFDQAPQVPFSSIRVRFDGGPTGALATSLSCGSSSASASLTPWSGSGTVTAESPGFFTSVAGDGAGSCPGLPFSPAVTAGSASSTSGRTSAFSLRLQRSDKNQELGALTSTLSPGVTAIVRGASLCSLEAAAAGTCLRESQIGTVTVGAGAGPLPFYVSGKAFLTQGYKGGAYGLSFVIPVIAGPFDLGTVVVQAAVRVDPVTAQLTIASDPFPRIVQGIPLRVRDVRVNIDRPRLTLNPTNCKQFATSSRVSAVQGASVVVRTPYQASGCSRQAYRPKIKLALHGRGQTTDGKHPGLTAAVELARGTANVSTVAAKLPSSLALDPGNAQTLCKFEDGRRVACPKTSIVGRAKISTPLLNRPLRGPVYFVENQRRNKFGRIVKTLPTLLLTLRGEVALNIRAKTSVAGGKNLVTTFSGLPDQPFSRFDLAIDGGKNGILAANTSICKASRVSEFETDGQNGKHYDPDVALSAPCGKREKRSRAR